MSEASQTAGQRETVPWWTWGVPFFLFHLGTWASLHFKLPGVASVYIPTTLGIVLIHWGARGCWCRCT